jgi:hypothetical protein
VDFKLDYVDNGYHEVDRYGSDDYDYSWSTTHDYVYRCAFVADNGYSDVSLFPGEQEPKIGDNIHVVYVCYSTGDSFGQDTGIHEHLWAFTDYSKADELALAICEDSRKKPDYDYNHEPLSFEGVSINPNNWKGYFERFEKCDIETLLLKRKYS